MMNILSFSWEGVSFVPSLTVDKYKPYTAPCQEDFWRNLLLRKDYLLAIFTLRKKHKRPQEKDK